MPKNKIKYVHCILSISKKYFTIYQEFMNHEYHYDSKITTKLAMSQKLVNYFVFFTQLSNYF